MTNQFAPLPEVEEIIQGDFEPILPLNVREVLLDVILAWANLEMATGFFVAQALGLNPDEGAGKFGRKIIENKLKMASSALERCGKLEIAERISKIARDYPEKTLLRRRIAHSKCVGVRKSIPEKLIFLPFECEGPPGNLAVEIIHLSKFSEATKWAETVHDYLMHQVEGAIFFGS